MEWEEVLAIASALFTGGGLIFQWAHYRRDARSFIVEFELEQGTFDRATDESDPLCMTRVQLELPCVVIKIMNDGPYDEQLRQVVFERFWRPSLRQNPRDVLAARGGSATVRFALDRVAQKHVKLGIGSRVRIRTMRDGRAKSQRIPRAVGKWARAWNKGSRDVMSVWLESS